MRFPDLFRLAMRNSFRGGIKSLLCAGAVCIGICSVCTIWGISDAAENAVASELNELGVGGTIFYADNDSDAEAAVLAASQVSGVQAVMPLIYKSGNVKLRNQRMNAAICGIGDNMTQVLSVTLLHGRLPGPADLRDSTLSAVIDEQTAINVYKRSNIVGKHIFITVDGTGVEFTVIGVIKSQKKGLETLLGGSLPCIVYVPYTTLSLLGGKGESTMFALSSCKDVDSLTINQTVAESLKKNLSVNFQFENLDKYTDSFRRITETVSLLVSGIAAISIFVGGLGVMNSMVAVVDSRVGEIGIWLALGAKRKTIAWCYLLEALIICLAGGLFGVLFSTVILSVLSGIFEVNLTLSMFNVVLALLGASFCGMLFGCMPALRAARMNPIAAIQNE